MVDLITDLNARRDVAFRRFVSNWQSTARDMSAHFEAELAELLLITTQAALAPYAQASADAIAKVQLTPIICMEPFQGGPLSPPHGDGMTWTLGGEKK